MVVLETLEGFVDSIRDGTAYVTLKNKLNEDVLWGEYPAAKLAALGIREGRRFIYNVIEDGEIELIPIPDKKLSYEEEMAIYKEIEEKLGPDDKSQDDY